MAQILIFGDSITDGSSDSMGGWADRLRQYFWVRNITGDIDNDEYYWLYNLGISGDLTTDVLKRIEVESIARKVAQRAKGVVFVFAIGINDSALEGTTNPSPHLNVDQFSKNYQSLISFAKKYTDKILCINITPVDETKTNPIYDNLWYKNDRIQQFNEVIKEVATKNQANFIDIHAPFSEEPNFVKMMIDGLHPNDHGHLWMLEHIKPQVLKILNIR